MKLFKTFEKSGMSIDDEWHLFVLHYLFVPRIKEELDEFKNAWNNHPVSTERNESPLQMLALRANNFPPEEDIDQDVYGVDGDSDWDEDDGEDYRVPCDPIFCPLTPQNYAIFVRDVKPLTLDTPPPDLQNWFYHAIEIILKIKRDQE